jgi:probable rRNA maturation factor
MTARPRRHAKAAPLIEVIVESPRWKAQRRASSIVKKAVLTAAQAASTPRAGLAIVLTDDSAIRALNRKWRGLDAPTNVLSFPAKMPRDRNSSGPMAGHLGDIVIAYQTTAREAKAENKPFAHHLSHLAIHGFLHLLGYDHETNKDARGMEQLEIRILRRLKVPDPYTTDRTEH